jgi:hypothetical protein
MALEVAPGAKVDERAAEARPGLVPAWQRLDEQISWYDRRSATAKRWYLRLKVTQIVIAAAIPVAAAADAPSIVPAVLGALIVVFEGIQQLFQFHSNWTTYRSTCEALKHEKYLYSAGAGPYAEAPDRDARLAERVEGLVSQEHAAWTSTQQDAGRDAGRSNQ